MKQYTQSLLYIILFMLTTAAYGQNITGKIVDEQDMPMEFVNVVALSTDSTFITGTMSRENGKFNLILPNDKEVNSVRISFVGYTNKTLPYKTNNMGIISLVPSTQLLQETVITARRPAFQLVPGGVETNIANSLLSVAGTANDVLSKLPNVNGKDGSFTVFGKGTAQIYLNGRQIHDPSVLDRLNSTDIQSVEVISNPEASYDNAVKAVIKIKTKKKNGDGISGTLRGAYTQAHRSGYTGMAYLNIRERGLDIFGDLYYNSNYLKQDQNGTQEIYHKSLQDNNLNILSHFQYISGSVGMNYEFNQNHSIGFTYTIDKRPGNACLNNEMNVTQPNGIKEKLLYETINDFPSGINHLINSYYSGNIGKLSVDFNFDYVTQKKNSDQYTKEYDSNLQLQEVTTNANSNSRLLASKLILTYPLGKGKFNLGGEYTYTQRTNVFTNEQKLLDASDDKINENTTSCFTEYGIQWANWTLNAGVRFQVTKSDYYEQGIFIDKQSKNYSDLLPNISIGAQFDKVHAQFSYTVKKTRPAYYMLNSNVQYNDRFSYEGGNPLLQPATQHDITLSFAYSWLNLSASYLYIKDKIMRIDKLYNEDAILFTFNNFNKIEELNAQVSISPKVGIWQPMYSINVGKQFLDADKLQISDKLDKPIVYFKLNNSFSLPYSLILRADFYYATKGNDETYLYKPYSNLSIGLSKNFCKDKLWITLSATDILKGDYSKSIFYGSYILSSRNNYSDTRKITVTCRYFFNKAKDKYKGTGAGADEKRRL